jgi:hypothetical protein
MGILKRNLRQHEVRVLKGSAKKIGNLKLDTECGVPKTKGQT